MKNEWDLINNWCDPYLNAMETLYGSNDLQPELTIAEQGEEWKECFRADGQVQADLQQRQSIMEYSESYLETIEDLYGEINLHPWLTIQEVAEEWQRCFMTDTMQVYVSPQKSINKPLKTAS